MRIQKARVAMGELDVVGQDVWDHISPRPRMGRVVSESVLLKSGASHRYVNKTHGVMLTSRPPFASQTSGMSQSSATTYSTAGTSSISSATTITSPSTSKGSWGEMLSPPVVQPYHARPLPIPSQSNKLDPVSIHSSIRRN
jgi:hypothetical protein